MKKGFILMFLVVATMSLFAPMKVSAIDYNHRMTDTVKKEAETHDQPQNCDSILGNPSDESSVAWLVQKILNYIQILGPLLVVVLSSVDFAKVIISGDDDAMAKSTKKLGIRLALAASLFFLPVLVSVLLNTFGLTSDPTCGLK